MDHVARVQVDLYGSLALTGQGHATDRAVLLGLAGNEPATIDPAAIDLTVKEIRVAQRIELAGTRPIHFDEIGDMLLHRETMFPPGAQTQHPNGLRLTAFDAAGVVVEQRTFFSIGGGFITEDVAPGGDGRQRSTDLRQVAVPFPFHSAAELVAIAEANELSSSCLRMSARWSGTMPIGLLWKWCGRALTASGRRCGIALRAELRLREFCLAA
jgi:L-serine dehydratase